MCSQVLASQLQISRERVEFHWTMVDLMSLSLELATNTVVLVTQPLSLMKVVCMFGMRFVFLVTHIWLQLVRGIINFNADVFRKLIAWTFAFVSLPLRILTALQRERLLEMHLHELQLELENIAWDKKQLNERLQITIKDCRIMGSIISELEEEHEKAVARVELLETELQDLKDENIRLTMILGNGKWNLKGEDEGDKCENVVDYDTPLLKRGEEIMQDLVVHRKAWEDEKKSVAYHRIGSTKESSGVMIPTSASAAAAAAAAGGWQCREVAVSQSLFSAILSLLVGMITWEAGDPCMPLVIALFIVVGMSLWRVVHFFSTINNRPASEAVALLSFNWFVLGTLAYPTLPKVAQVLMPLVLSLADRVAHWLGVSSIFSKD